MSEPVASLFIENDFYGGAEFDADRIYRYVLWRAWDRRRPVLIVVMLNPSIADEEILDPSVKKCVEWARSWDYGALYVLNAFALRSTDPRLLYEHAQAGGDPVGPDNDHRIRETLDRYPNARIIVGWGKRCSLLGRDEQMIALLAGRDLYCLGINKDNSPEHPLYIAKATEPQIWRAAA